ncbi:MAG: TerC family protein [Armatimonadetes bacterium]|nr:TerC family protein [Armatimonadota bacterium]
MTPTILLWVVFNLFVLGMLALDLGVFHRRAHTVSLREAGVWTAIWIALALVFNVGVYMFRGPEPALEFLAAYLIEKSLSVDNIFVFLVIFTYFAVPAAYQHRVLFWGILGALITRAIFIATGLALLKYFHWVIYLFGAVLIYTAWKMLTQRETSVHPERNPVLKVLRRRVSITPGYEGDRFFVVREGRRLATPLLVVLAVIESTDLVFAVDSIPAVIAITRDPFIVYTSNVFAILGLRALYFVLAGVMDLFHYLRYGLGVILAFVGVKMIASDVYKMPITASLAVISAVLAISVAASVVRNRVLARRQVVAEEAGSE